MSSDNTTNKNTDKTTENTTVQDTDLSLDQNKQSIQLKYAPSGIFVFKRMIGKRAQGVKLGDVVTVLDKFGKKAGMGVYNPKSNIQVRMLRFGEQDIDQEFIRQLAKKAVDLRESQLRLQDHSDAYRLIHAEGDGLSGLIVDRYQNVLVVSMYSAAMWNVAIDLIPYLHELTGTDAHIIHMDDRVRDLEGVPKSSFYNTIQTDNFPGSIKISENGVRFKVSLDMRHKTGFFCDQRENRMLLSQFTNEKSVLDMCCHAGGFGLYAKINGNAKEVTSVDVDEQAISLTKSNADLNQVRLQTAQSDAFVYLRQMQMNQKQFDVIVLDPPKFVFGREDNDKGKFKYADMNRLAAPLITPGGLLVTCSCSGALQKDEFITIVTQAVRHAGRSCQVLKVTGASMDHPISPRCKESEYLKVAWLRIL